MDKVLAFRVLPPDQFESPLALRASMSLINLALAAGSVAMIRRGLRGRPMKVSKSL